ncbi:MAG: hypothetical protein QF768_21640 [Candidatus Latescibacteria bacterium]|jgi:hypothetical protein|nr:hypothetical protein [Candidatus Latescibacterota bacterium]
MDLPRTDQMRREMSEMGNLYLLVIMLVLIGTNGPQQPLRAIRRSVSRQVSVAEISASTSDSMAGRRTWRVTEMALSAIQVAGAVDIRSNPDLEEKYINILYTTC